MSKKQILIIGGGAAGYFAAITAAEQSPESQVVIAEASGRPLQKVAISGGGRCNVTQACFDTRQLSEYYPRGRRELLGPFSRFQPSDTVQWFKDRGVELKTEDDGRMFPVTDSSKTIIDCFEKTRLGLKIDLRLKTKVVDLRRVKNKQLKAVMKQGDKSYAEDFDTVLFASGGAKSGYQMAKELGHTIEPCVPSLFTFEVRDKRLENLSGVSVECAQIELEISGKATLSQSGPLLVTHWGFSGPAVIKLSAWGARPLYENKYQAQLKINWCPNEKRELFSKNLRDFGQRFAKRLVQKSPAIQLPKRLWENLCEASQIDEDLRYAELPREKSRNLEKELFDGCYQVSGKGVFKEEFVTCGGISLSEVNFSTMESKLIPGLFFAGEILDIDGITGGYNFQSAWTTGFIAGMSF